MPPPRCPRPGDLVRKEDGGQLPLYDDPAQLGKMSLSPTSWAPWGSILTVLAVCHGEAGHERVLVLHGEGRTGWCWGGYLACVGDDP